MSTRVIAGCAAAALAIAIGVASAVAAAHEDRTPDAHLPVAASTTPAAVSTEPPAEPTPGTLGSTAPSGSLLAEPDATEPVPESSALDAHQVGGLVDTLTPEDYSAAATAAVRAATALTTQSPDEDQVARRDRLGPLFTPDAAGRRQEGPVPDPTAVVEPVVVNWTTWFDPHDDQQIGVLVSVHFRSSTGTTTRSYREGDVEWRVRVTRAPQGWLAAAVQLDATSS